MYDLGLTEAQRRRLRTTNGMQSLNKQIPRRTRVAGLFLSETSLLRLVSAVLMEIGEEWETGRRYLPKDDEWPALHLFGGRTAHCPPEFPYEKAAQQADAVDRPSAGR